MTDDAAAYWPLEDQRYLAWLIASRDITLTEEWTMAAASALMEMAAELRALSGGQQQLAEILADRWRRLFREAAVEPSGGALPRLTVDAHGEVRPPGWVARNKLLTALLLVVLVVLSEPAWARLLPPEVHEFLSQEEGPAAFCMALVAAVTAAMAVNNSKNKKD